MFCVEKVERRFESIINAIIYMVTLLVFMRNVKEILDFWFGFLNKINWGKDEILIIVSITAYVLSGIVTAMCTSYITYTLYEIFIGKYLIKKCKIFSYLIMTFLDIVLKISIICFIVVTLAFSVAESTGVFEFKGTCYFISRWYSQLNASDMAKTIELSAEVLYNGTSLDDAIKSSEEIKNTTLKLIEDCSTDREKAKKIYDWIGTNIVYDKELSNNLADEVFKNTFGARYAYENKSGVCFDFASLYAVMLREAGIKVRLIVGQGFDGEVFGSHAWNEVFLKDENIWINVDATFWGLDDSFDTELFNDTHIKESVAGEW